MKNKLLKYGVIAVTVVFLMFYFLGGRIYNSRITEKKVLTEEQIKKFEEDVKNNVEIDINEYVFKEEDYTNQITKINNKISSIIEKGFKKAFQYLLKNINV